MKILFFSPFSFYSNHALPESLVAEALQNKGHEIISVGCNRIYKSYCLCMSGIPSNSSNDAKEKICISCIKNRDLIRKEFSFKTINIDDYLNQKDIDYVNLETRILDIGKYLDYQFDKIPIGRYSLYEFLLNRKLNSTDLNNEEWTEFKLYFKNVFFTLIAGKKIFEIFKPDRISTYNSCYSVNHIMCSLAEQRNIPHYSLHAGSHHKYRLSEMTIFKGFIPMTTRNSHPFWNYYKEKPLSSVKIKRAEEHISNLLEAKSPWVYSVKSNGTTESELREFFGIRDNQKVLLATMASVDERFAAAIVDASPLYQEPLFETQLKWIEFLINFVRNEPSLFLIIRIHPREFPNKRESVLSKQALILQTAFNNLPSNVAVNFPKDSISLHDLIKITDVGLNATSSSGLELLLFGVPVVIYDWNQLASYAREINMLGATETEYKEQIFKAIRLGWSLDNVIKAYRWISYLSDVSAVDISDGYKTPSLLNKAFRKILRLFRIKHNEQLLIPIKNRSKPLKNQDLLTVAIEKGLNSHLDDMDYTIADSESATLERALVKKNLMRFSKCISSNKDDIDFRNRIEQICKE